MKIIIETTAIGASLAQAFLDDLSTLINAHVVSSGNKLQFSLPPVAVGDDGVWELRVSVEFGTQPAKRFLDRT